MAEDAPDKIKRAPFPTEIEAFKDDERVSYDQVTQSHKLEDEAGEEWEWLPKPAKWVPVTDEALIAQQQRAYAMEGVDENEPAMDPRKRKAGDDEGNGKVKKQKAEKPAPAPKQNNAIYITSLPADADEDEIEQVFSKYGMIAESATNSRPRIKLYMDDQGKFKGDALVVYFRPESVVLAISMLDDTDFRMGTKVATGPMRVTQADPNYKSQKEQPLKSEQAKTKGTGANRDRQKVIQKNEEMRSRLADWGDDDDNPSTLQQVHSRWDKVVVMKHLFTLEELATDPEAISDISDDVREECEKFGKVTNLVLYDKEPDGVITVRYAEKTSADAAIRVFDGRMFGGKAVEAYIADGSEKFMKTRKGETDGDAERADNFGKYLEEQEEA